MYAHVHTPSNDNSAWHFENTCRRNELLLSWFPLSNETIIWGLWTKFPWCAQYSEVTKERWGQSCLKKQVQEAEPSWRLGEWWHKDKRAVQHSLPEYLELMHAKVKQDGSNAMWMFPAFSMQSLFQETKKQCLPWKWTLQLPASLIGTEI